MISIIVAMARGRVIGGDNKLLWHISEDLRRFKSITMGCPIIMGRKSYESIGRPLPGRQNIVLSSDKNLKIEGCEVVGTIDEAIGLCDRDKEIFIIGGGQVYAQTMDFVDRLYITYVDAEYAGDTFFPEIDSDIWQESSRQDFERGDKFEAPFSFVDYTKK